MLALLSSTPVGGLAVFDILSTLLTLINLRPGGKMVFKYSLRQRHYSIIIYTYGQKLQYLKQNGSYGMKLIRTKNLLGLYWPNCKNVPCFSLA